VLNDLSEEVCLANAQACARKAADVTDAKIKQAFLDIERSWLILAQSFPDRRGAGDHSLGYRRKRPDVQALIRAEIGVLPPAAYRP